MARSFPRGLKPADLAALIGTDKSVPFQSLVVSVQNNAAVRPFPGVREGQLQILRFALDDSAVLIEFGSRALGLDDSGVLLSTGLSCLLRHG